jgi:hypothetical protein
MSEQAVVLTREIIQNWSKEEMIRAMSDPERRTEIEQVWNAPTAEEIAAKEAEAAAEAAAEAEENRLIEEAKQAVIEEQRQQAEVAAAAEAETARIAAEEAEKARLAAEPKAELIVVEYQATDDVTGEPIGRKTHIQGYSWQEIAEKEKIAHINAVRYAERIKRQRSKPNDTGFVPMTDEQRLAEAEKVRSDDPKESMAASAKLVSDSEARRLAAEAKVRGQEAALAFMRKHILDYNPCDANSKVLTAYMEDNGLAWTADNIEIAFEETASQLAPVVAKTPPPPPVVPEIVPTVDNTPVPAKPVAAVEAPAAPVVLPVAAPNPPAPPKKTPDGGLIPGESLSGSRPVGTRPVGLTKKDIKDMAPAEFRRRLVHEKGFREKVDALFAKK